VIDTNISETLLSVNDIVVGSDEEKALVKAIKASLPNSELTFCTRHLSENMSRYMRNKVGMNEKATKQVVDEIFGDNGLIEADTTVVFTKQVNIIESKYQTIIGPFLTKLFLLSRNMSIMLESQSQEFLCNGKTIVVNQLIIF
jgi:hypothetical protein